MTKIRTFVAIDIPESMRRQLAAQIDWLRERVPENSVSWARPVGIHLTLQFLGEISPQKAQDVGCKMKRIVSGFTPFSLRIAHMGVFPNDKRPRVIWVGVDEPSGSLLRLQSILTQQFEQLGFERERRDFHPHLTLGRVRRSTPSFAIRQLGETLAGLDIGDLGQVSVQAIHLFRSELKPSGAIYTCLQKSIFGSGE